VRVASPDSRGTSAGQQGVHMGFRFQAGVIAAALVLSLAACSPNDGPKQQAGSNAPAKPAPAAAPAADGGDGAGRLETAANVDGDRIVHADSTPGDWLSYGRTYS